MKALIMDISIKSITLLISILGTGLTAGLCFTWTNAVAPGIGRLEDLMFLQSFQAMNRSIINPSFMIVFFSPVILLFLNTYLSRNANPNLFWLYLSAFILFFVGVGFVTIFKNVPLNELLDNTMLESATEMEIKDLRKAFETPWKHWHMIRTLTAISSFVLLLIASLFTK